MTDPTTKTRSDEHLWLDKLCLTYTQLSCDGAVPSREALAAAVAKAVDVDLGRVSSWLAGVDLLADYAAAELDDGAALDEEDRGLDVSRSVTRPVFEARLQARLRRAEAARTGPVDCTMCGGVAPSEGWRRRTLLSSLGAVTLRRPYHYCSPCGTGWFASEAAIGLDSSKWTPKLGEMITKLSTVAPYGMATEICTSLVGAPVSVRGAEQLVERRAAFVSLRASLEAGRLAPHDRKGFARHIVRPADAVKKPPNTAYFETDGVFAMVREYDPERSKEAPPGARGGKGRRYEVVGREVKNGILYTDDDCATDGGTRGCLLDKKYVSHLGSWQAFAARVWPEMLRMRFDQAATRVVLSDGAAWIRQLCAWLPFTVLLILDLFHVKKRINEVAHALFPEDELGRHRWRAVQYDRAEGARVDELLAALAEAEPRGKTAVELVSALETYIANNRDRMDYPSYRAAGLRVGSGAIESANFHVTGNRLKLQGMRWSELGAADMAMLRADLFNGRWRARTEEMLAA